MDHPVKFINHEVADTLDSSDAFEGPEKLLELWFEPAVAAEPEAAPGATGRGLLAVPRDIWEPMLDTVHCKVLSVVSYGGLDAYVLSESSFFVYENRLVLKTCGRTTLLEGLAPILAIVAKFTDLAPTPVRAFYSHRGFLFPSQQVAPHGSWAEEVARLKEVFPSGQAWTFGDAPTEQWHLFSWAGHGAGAAAAKRGGAASLEMMMTELDPAAAERFYSHRAPGSIEPMSDSNAEPSADDSRAGTPDSIGGNSLESSVASLETLASVYGADPDDDDPGHLLGNIMTKTAVIDEIYPTAEQVIDSFAFSPCGYSCNGVVEQDKYYTIHVTPEHGFSYASFETTVPEGAFDLGHAAVVERVLRIFRPGRVTLVVFDVASRAHLEKAVPGYTCTASVAHDVAPNQVCYMTFERERA